MDTVVAGFDGTDASFVALDWIADRAERRRFAVELVRVVPAESISVAEEDPVLREGTAYLTTAAPTLAVTPRMVPGRVPDALLAAARGSDLLVIGAHRRRPMRSALTGWRPARTVAQSATPVVVVPSDWKNGHGPVIVGLDDDDSSSSALELAADEAASRGVELLLVHAWQMSIPDTDGVEAYLDLPATVKSEHRRLLDDARVRLGREREGLVVTSALVQDNPTAALISAAARASLLVIGTHHRGLLESAFLGSVVQDLLPIVRVPLWVVPTAAPVR